MSGYTLIDENKGFKVFWSFYRQHYKIYRDGKYVRTVYKFSDAKPYLD